MGTLRVGAAALVVALTAATLQVHGVAARAPQAAPLDPHIPNEPWLIAHGLSGTPAPGQPASPVVVDRVLADGVATYMQYHLTDAYVYGDAPMPFLFAARGAEVNDGAASGPSGGGYYYAYLGPLPVTARAAVLHIAVPGSTDEVVRVPLDLRALATRRVSHPGTRVRAHGLTLTVRQIDASSLTYAAPVGAVATSATLTSITGRALPVTSVLSVCTPTTAPTAPTARCTGSWVFPIQRPGTRLTVTIPTFWLAGSRAVSKTTVVRGPWRFSFVTP